MSREHDRDRPELRQEHVRRVRLRRLRRRRQLRVDLREPSELVRVEVKLGEGRVRRGDVPPHAPQRARERHRRYDAPLDGASSPNDAVEVRDGSEASPCLVERVERRLPRPGGHHDHARCLICGGSCEENLMVLYRVPTPLVGCNIVAPPCSAHSSAVRRSAPSSCVRCRLRPPRANVAATAAGTSCSPNGRSSQLVGRTWWIPSVRAAAESS